ncbi:MAG: hypothetical protein ACXVB9_17980 [Bdellovibrionota bacterium]
MRASLIFFFALTLSACSSSETTPERAAEAPDAGTKKAAAQTDQCLDNPDLSRAWGECNVKNTVFQASSQLEKCRAASPGAKGTVDFELHVKANGTVKSAKAKGGKHGKHTACVARVLKKLKFASPGKDATITVPYQLEP